MKKTLHKAYTVAIDDSISTVDTPITIDRKPVLGGKASAWFEESHLVFNEAEKADIQLKTLHNLHFRKLGSIIASSESPL